jgi:Adenylate and Guanylate cyclase catalytic domain
MSPLNSIVVNYNMNEMFSVFPKAADLSKARLSAFRSSVPGYYNDTDVLTAFNSGFLSTQAQKIVPYEGDAMGYISLPIFPSYDQNNGADQLVAKIEAYFQWAAFFKDVLPIQAKGIVFVLENQCSPEVLSSQVNGKDDIFSYQVNGKDVAFLGKGDLHDARFNNYETKASLSNITTIEDGTEFGIDFDGANCLVSIRIYPSVEFYDQYTSSLPIMMTVTVVMAFLFTMGLFLFYNRLVERRQQMVLTKAVESRAFVSSLFPKSIAERILKDNNESDTAETTMSSKGKIRSWLDPAITNTGAKSLVKQSPLLLKPMADLFLNTTVMFADIAGFTAWSSSREPSQVFLLLQSVYHAYDVMAKRRRVFKVETIGDSYVAVTGLPEPQRHHALIMARFASDCLKKFIVVTRELDVKLGPGTSGKFILRLSIIL